MTLSFHFLTVVVMTVLISVIVMRRYAEGVRRDMAALSPTPLGVAPAAPFDRLAPLTIVEIDADSVTPRAAREGVLKEQSTRRAIIAAYLISTALCGGVISVVTLWAAQTEVIASRFVGLTGAIMGAAIPMIAVSVAWSFWRALIVWMAFEIAVASLSVIVPMLSRLVRGQSFDPTLAMNAVYVFQWTAAALLLPFAMAFATSIRKLRGVAPMSLALISVVGLVPVLGAKGATRLIIEEDIGLRLIGVTLVIYASFFVLAPLAGWLAWRVLKLLSNGYDAKRFSDAQLLASVWWLIFVATLIAGVGADPAVAVSTLLLAGTASFTLFPLVSGALLRMGTRQIAVGPQPILLLLRLFGETSRSERFFDRVIARWRLIGPVTVIAAPDILARTIDPVDFLRFVTGRAGEAFVESQAQLDGRLERLDLHADPDGRYRVTEFCCRGNSWQATVTALMSRCDAVVADVRGLTAGREGVRYELEQLASRVPADRIVLVVDGKTDRAVIEQSVAAAQGTLRLVRVERNSRSEIRRVFETLVAATHPTLQRPIGMVR